MLEKVTEQLVLGEIGQMIPCEVLDEWLCPVILRYVQTVCARGAQGSTTRLIGVSEILDV